MSRRTKRPPSPAQPVPRRGPRFGGPALVALLVLGGAASVAIVRWSWPWAGSRQETTPSVLLITIDTLRWDRLGCYGDSRAATPVIDALARRGTRFETAVAHTPLTAPSHASILTGLTPLRHGVRDNGAFVLPPELPTLGSTFGGAGYTTAAFVSGYPLHRRYGFASGFGTYDDAFPRGASQGSHVYVERRADDTTARVIAWLDAQRAAGPGTGAGAGAPPWLLWVHYFDPHAAYEPPGEFAARFAGRPYDGEVAFVDAQVGRLLGHLERLGDLERTLVVVTADHGESLGEHNEETHGVFVYDATLRVPLIVAGPGAASGRVSPVVARGVDLLPTIVDLAGLVPPARLDGRSLRPALEGRPMGDEPAYIESVLTERHLGWAPLHGLRDAQWKFIDAPRRELYDLTQDSGETRDRASQDPDRVTSMARQLQAQMRTSAVAAAAPKDRDAGDRLRALGYFGGGATHQAAPSGRDPKDGIGLITRLEHGIADVQTNPARAEEVLRQVLAEDPGVDLARRHLALALVGLGDHRAAIGEFVQLQGRGAASAEDLVLLSESLRVAGRPDESRRALAEAARLDPRSPEPVLTEARTLMAAQRPSEAAAAFQRALALVPDHPEALLGLGDAALAQGDVAGAAGWLERALARDPGDLAARRRLAVVRAREGRFQEAQVLFRQVVDAEPANADGLAGLAAALARSGRPAEAVPYFERALAAGARTPPVLNGLGFARLESGDREGALSALRASLALRPDQPQVHRIVEDLSAGREPRS